MATVPTSARLPGILPGSTRYSRTPEEQQAHIQHKAQKKQRRLDRLLSFLSWCEGCRSYGNSV